MLKVVVAPIFLFHWQTASNFVDPPAPTVPPTVTLNAVLEGAKSLPLTFHTRLKSSTTKLGPVNGEVESISSTPMPDGNSSSAELVLEVCPAPALAVVESAPPL